MNLDFASRILKRIQKPDPPGCCGTYLDHPFPPYRQREVVEIGFVIEHRYAFHYWLKCKQKMMPRHGAQATDVQFCPPDLITWDWHDDVGGECDFIEKELVELNQTDEQEVALLCWAGLRQINDGHIAPAIWLNALGNVYVLQRQRDDEGCKRESREVEDRYGHSHSIRYFRSPQKLARCFEETHSRTGVIWDVDLDFFTEESPVPDQRYSPPVGKRTIRAILNPKKRWMQQILGNLKMITIAIEPEYTGGLTTSLDLYRTWEQALFAEPVFSSKCRWRDDLFE